MARKKSMLVQRQAASPSPELGSRFTASELGAALDRLVDSSIQRAGVPHGDIYRLGSLRAYLRTKAPEEIL